MVKGDKAKIHAFHSGSLRKICGIVWPNKIHNVQLYNKTGCTSAVLETKKTEMARTCPENA